MNLQTIKSPFVLLWTLLIIGILHSNSYADPSASDPKRLRPIQDIHDELLDKFTYVEAIPEEDVAVNHSGEEPFSGDCDDFYTAAFNQLWIWGYTPYAQILASRKTGQGHLVACTESGGRDLCLEYNRKRVMTLRQLRRVYHLVERRDVPQI